MVVTQHSTFTNLYTRFYRDYKNMSDKQIVLQAQHGHRESLEYILDEHQKIVIGVIKQKGYFFKGAEMTDVIQEGMIGLFKAIINFKEGSFYKFAELCITCQIISGIRTATRQKTIPLNERINIEGLTYQHYATDADPEENIIRTETIKLLEKILSPFELKVLQTYQEGKTYQEISNKLKCTIKSIDNALSRTRKKRSHLAHYFQK